MAMGVAAYSAEMRSIAAADQRSAERLLPFKKLFSTGSCFLIDVLSEGTESLGYGSAEPLFYEGACDG